MNPTRPYGPNTIPKETAERMFTENSKDYVQKEGTGDTCPNCTNATFEYWESQTAHRLDYEYCPECGYSRAYLPD